MFGSLPSGTMIEVAPGTYREALAYADSNKSFTLRGSGAASTIIDATGQGRPALRIRDTNGLIRVEGFTFTGASNLVGGGVVFERASATLADCIVEGNTTSTNGGGLVLTSSGPTTIDNCTVRGNTAANAGGGAMIGSGSEVNILDSRFENNRSGTASSAGTGGGIQINDSSVEIRSTVVTGNEALFAGGGIFAIGIYGSPNGLATLLLEDVELSWNTVTRASAGSPLAEGGGMHIEANTVATITRGKISDNTSDSGGGLNSAWGRYEITDSVIENNRALIGQGGGVHAISLPPRRAEVILTRSVVRSNSGVNTGGVLVSGDDCYAGGVCAILTISSSLVDSNVADLHGGGVSSANAVLTVSDSQILRNQVTATSGGSFGGGVRIVAGTATITDSTIADNSAGQRGGGLFIENGAAVTIDGVNIYNNATLDSDGGGGIHVGSSGPPTGSIENSQIADNSDYQIREVSCPIGVPAPILTYRFNRIANQGPARTYFSPCYPGVDSVAAFNNLSPGLKTVGNTAGAPDFVSLVAAPPAAPSVLGWSVARSNTVYITELGNQPGPTGTADVAPDCTTTYSVDGASAVVIGTDSAGPPPPSCSGQQTIFNQSLGGQQTFEAGQMLEAEQVTVQPGAEISFRAGETVMLTEPFAVLDGATFVVDVDACLCNP